MKKKLLLFTFLISYSIFGQIPNNGIVASYSFTNRNTTTDDVNVAPLTQTGTALNYTNDRFEWAHNAIPNTANAINLNGDHLSRADVNANQLTYSFWIRTNTNTPDEKTIIDDSNRTSPGFGNNQYGNYVYLQNGKIGIRGRVSYRIPNTSDEQKLITSTTTSVVADGFWHHIVAIIYNQGDVKKINTEIWVDGVREDNDFIQNSYFNTTLNRNIYLTNNFNTTGNVVIANNRNEDFADVNKYQDSFDDFLIYSRQLNATEINQIGTNAGFCYPSDASSMSVSNINDNSAVITQNLTTASVGQGQSIKVDLAYHKSSESFQNATILTNVGLTTTLTNLEINEEYKVYIRKECTAGSNVYNSFSQPLTFETFGNLYVDASATGTGDGKTWENAITTMTDAINAVREGQSIFVAKGTYKANNNNDRTQSLRITRSNINIYGGFSGFETNINQRIPGKNETIITGDLLGNDSGNNSFSTFTYNENSKTIFKILNGIDNIVFDGLTIRGAYNDADLGGALFCSFDMDNLTINNCIIENNLAVGGAGIYKLYSSNAATTSSLTQKVTITNSIFRNNVGTYGTGLYLANVLNRAGTQLTIDITNNLFYNNSTQDNGANQGYLGSSLWIRNLRPDVDYITNISNNTFVNNSDIATRYNSNEQATLSFTFNGGTNSSHTVTMNNNIQWNNTTVGNATAASIAGIPDGFPTINIKNSIAQDNYTNIDNNIGTKSNISDADPLFTDASNDDFTLASNSPAIDGGFNDAFATQANAVDVAQNLRIANTTVDIGAYEYASTAAIPIRTLTLSATNGTITKDINTNVTEFTDGTTINLTATPDAGYVFSGWTGDVANSNSNDNPLNVVLDADKTITANFARIQRTLSITATNGSVSTNPQPVNGTFDDGTSVTLTATPDAGYVFNGWTGDVATSNSSDNPLNIVLDADKNITANFSKIQRTLTITAINGSVSVNPQPVNGTYDDGTTVTLTATPDAGFAFDNWTGDVTANTSSITFDMNADINVTANFRSTASIKDTFKIDFKTYPNPTNNIINIIVDEELEKGEVYNLLGKKIMSFTTNQINLGELSKGIYLIKVKTVNGKIGIRNVIKK